ncbi:hypothetical protein ASPWEDRAFT_669753 [Aspergillus wentii DTO 134E9]|uniref:Serine protease n=1 Tax=Aspergillus wentii DTO 134E9 TaxID=1073089 RepID=A0A1L9RCA4_ASPWE|nr:uncharacterized protein ASPWEDRAFT_669753 [Aspergillus wentii DTO 134E9]OJJ32542.1 hypothetical protein ASPWEDRAFT_669753 [Aspergillus wentii DTO 134E9]
MAKLVVWRWNLEAPPTANAENAVPLEETPEDNVNITSDNRKLVPVEDIKEGGKYRSILKVMVQRGRSQNWYMGTGWLLTDDILATSAHLVYDRKTGEKARAFKVWMGYNGKNADPLKTDTIYRHRIAVTALNEYTALLDGTRDVAFVKVNEKFPNVSHRFDYIGTPTTGIGNLGIVGYPGDKSSNGENGAQMYEHYEQTTWNLNNTAGNVLEYNHVTEGGELGSPVLWNRPGQPLVSIGTHRGVHEKRAVGIGIPISGQFDYPYDSGILAFTETPTRSRNGVDYIGVERKIRHA